MGQYQYLDGTNDLAYGLQQEYLLLAVFISHGETFSSHTVQNASYVLFVIKLIIHDTYGYNRCIVT